MKNIDKENDMPPKRHKSNDDSGNKINVLTKNHKKYYNNSIIFQIHPTIPIIHLAIHHQLVIMMMKNKMNIIIYVVFWIVLTAL